jgi:hypothetical protein
LTIGQAGCLISALASVLVDCGVPTDPSRLNKWLIGSHGYAEGDLLIWESLEGIGLHLEERIHCEQVPAPLDRIVKALDLDQFVIVEVVINGHTDHPSSHFMRLYTVQPQGGWLLDAWRLPGAEMVGTEHYMADPAVGIVSVALYESLHRNVRWPMPVLDATAPHQERICLYQEE